MILTNQVVESCNQIGIPEAMIDLVIKFGSIDAHNGYEILSLDKKGMRKTKAYLGSLYSGSKKVLSDIYLVINNEEVIKASRKSVNHQGHR